MVDTYSFLARRSMPARIWVQSRRRWSADWKQRERSCRSAAEDDAGRLAPKAPGARRARERTASGSRRKEYERAHLDAFPRRRAGGQRVVEGGVERQAGAAVIGAVVHPNEQHLVGLHVREIVPVVRWVVFNSRGLTADL